MKHLLLYCFIILQIPAFSLRPEYKLVDLNIRYDNPNDFPNDWTNRSKGIINWLKKQNADIYFFQEALRNQMEDLQVALDHCGSYGIGREDGISKGEFSPIFYNTQKFHFISGETFWLSETPDKPSKGWDAACERIVTHIILCDKESHDTLDLLNTHWDHIGKEAQMHSAEFINHLIHSIPKQHFLICGGDFNSEIQSAPIQYLMTSNELVPSGNRSIWKSNSYHGFGKVDSGNCIDFIFYKQYQFENEKTYKIRHYRESWFGAERFLSDHDAVVSHLKILRNTSSPRNTEMEFRF